SQTRVKCAKASPVRRVLEPRMQSRALALSFEAKIQPAARRVCADQRNLVILNEAIDFKKLVRFAGNRGAHGNFASELQCFSPILKFRGAQERQPERPLLDSAEQRKRVLSGFMDVDRCADFHELRPSFPPYIVPSAGG